MIKLYGMTGSGNCWKPAVLMTQTGRAYEWVEVNILKGESRTPEYLAMNANGKVPLLQTPQGFLAESNAMLCYLAEGTPLLPAEPWARAQVLQWLFFEQYSHEPYIATVRFWVKFQGKQHEWKEKIAEAMRKGQAALGVMERQLSQSAFMAGAQYTVADIALYAYTAVAGDGGYELSSYPAIEAWLRRCEATPGFFRME